MKQMSSNEQLAPLPQATLIDYTQPVDLVAVRKDPVSFPRISATPRDQAVKRMTRIVYAAYLYRNQEIVPDMVRFTATALVDEINADTRYGLRSISWAELGMVVREAVLARDIYGISVASLYAALVDYAKTEGHEAARKALTTPNQNEK